VDIPINELAILCVAKILCGELTMAQSEFSSPMYIYIQTCGSTVGCMPWFANEFAQALDEYIVYSHN